LSSQGYGSNVPGGRYVLGPASHSPILTASPFNSASAKILIIAFGSYLHVTQAPILSDIHVAHDSWQGRAFSSSGLSKNPGLALHFPGKVSPNFSKFSAHTVHWSSAGPLHSAQW